MCSFSRAKQVTTSELFGFNLSQTVKPRLKHLEQSIQMYQRTKTFTYTVMLGALVVNVREKNIN